MAEMETERGERGREGDGCGAMVKGVGIWGVGRGKGGRERVVFGAGKVGRAERGRQRRRRCVGSRERRMMLMRWDGDSAIG